MAQADQWAMEMVCFAECLPTLCMKMMMGVTCFVIIGLVIMEGIDAWMPLTLLIGWILCELPGWCMRRLWASGWGVVSEETMNDPIWKTKGLCNPDPGLAQEVGAHLLDKGYLRWRDLRRLTGKVSLSNQGWDGLPLHMESTEMPSWMREGVQAERAARTRSNLDLVVSPGKADHPLRQRL